ncbi:MFS general substrate transporter [Colletotrichum asianum]
MKPPSKRLQSNPREKDSDPKSPPNAIRYSVFEPNQRQYIILLCALAGLFSPFSAFTYFPVIKYISSDLKVSLQLINLTVTIYLVVQGIFPAFFGDLADQIGRRPIALEAPSIVIANLTPPHNRSRYIGAMLTGFIQMNL